MSKKTEVIIIGGGAAGYFAAINIAESNPELNVTILEKSSKVLQKVKVSGGGRCNVTHACFDPKELVGFYPRGHKELLGPFHRFMTGDTIEWFEQRGIPLKIEDDLRMFPETNSSQTIIDCFLSSAEKAGVHVLLNQNVKKIEKTNEQYYVETKNGQFRADKLLIAAGGNSKIWELIESLGHRIIAPVPSLFTFNIDDEILKDIPGISVPNALVSIQDRSFESSGPLLITHWGISGPAVLKLSSLAAIQLADLNYNFSVNINWLSASFPEILELLKQLKKSAPKKNILLRSPFEDIPKRLWAKIVAAAKINPNQNWSDVSHEQLERLSEKITNTKLSSHGKTTFKEEFVTAGGVDLKEINFKKFESKLHPNLFFAGEVLNIDGLTGGFNFQNAWTGGFIAAKAIAES
ncbi:NAD(P)/FAD-dependent oxidoreductase [Lutimonas vermicola]|uniref:NAD(P)/FAD-dependent oxidoreductase n=1 Tax=Lutimonas vermicola TaxID=414288 RepID=A0ABU9L5A5_9FLAO